MREHQCRGVHSCKSKEGREGKYGLKGKEERKGRVGLEGKGEMKGRKKGVERRKEGC
jgi:hypothetical protein